MSQRRREASAWVTGIFNYGSPNRKSDECAATNDKWQKLSSLSFFTAIQCSLWGIYSPLHTHISTLHLLKDYIWVNFLIVMDFIQFTEYIITYSIILKTVDLSHHDLYFLKIPFLASKLLGFAQKLQPQIIILMIFMFVISQWQREYLAYIRGVYLNSFYQKKSTQAGR
jgi:hypothetical protein